MNTHTCRLKVRQLNKVAEVLEDVRFDRAVTDAQLATDSRDEIVITLRSGTDRQKWIDEALDAYDLLMCEDEAVA